MFSLKRFALALSLAASASGYAAAENLQVGDVLLNNFPPQEDSQNLTKVPKASKVIIVGAGASGLTAARILHDKGIDTVVLEASNRLGGRMFTANLDGTPIDLNGGFIHDLDINPLVKVYDQLGLGYKDIGTLADPRVDSYDAVTDKHLGVVDKARFLYHLNKFFGGPEKPPQTAADDYPVESWFKSYIADQKLDDVSGNQIVALLRTLQSTDGSDISMRWWGQYPKHGNDEVALPKDGYVQFANKLAEGIDVKLNHPVTKIVASNDEVTVEAAGEKFTGSHVIVTVPVSVLKKGAIAFEPALPETKQAAIKNAGMAKMEKYAFLFNEKDAAKIDFKTVVYNNSSTGVRITYVNISDQVNRPVVVGIVHTDYIEQFVKLDRTQRYNLVVNSLREMLKAPDLEPSESVESNWTDNPYSLGAYSYLRIGEGPKLIEDLAEPVSGGRVLFAGEATDLQRHEYVDGAVDSGVREARRLLSSN
ncbi:flavin monoamine oxidase family protein [Pseudomonas sp. BGr12]|uniref:flavin monoamine oxidase family protein n=1 Tax=Pseudomonas sp. BGr12 TaxID=2936269 RepID=UPI00255A05EC|nr:NAD(P)/FAD-dependent oxidoreductase [Pseudomonas sp. BJa5]MDL2426298.1 FAD-dependent oxidoreductase [Pseudomonas sp. BJa5]